MMMYADDDEYGLESFFPLHADANTRVSRANSCQDPLTESRRGRGNATPTPPPLSSWTAWKPSPPPLSSTEMLESAPSHGARSQETTATGRPKHSPLPPPTVTIADAPARPLTTDTHLHAVSANTSAHQSRETAQDVSLVRLSSMSAEYSGYLNALDAYDTPYVESSSSPGADAVHEASRSEGSYLYFLAHYNSTLQIGGQLDTPTRPAAPKSAPPSQPRELPEVKRQSPVSGRAGLKNTSSFFSHGAAVSQSDEDDSHSSSSSDKDDDDEAGEEEEEDAKTTGTHGSRLSGGRRGDRASEFDGASIFGDHRSHDRSVHDDEDEDDEEDEEMGAAAETGSADPDLISHAAESRQKRNQLPRAPNKPAGSRHAAPNTHLSKGRRVTSKSGRPTHHQANNNNHNHTGSTTPATQSTEGPTTLLPTSAQHSERVAAHGDRHGTDTVIGTTSGRNSALEATLPSLSEDLDAPAGRSVRRAVNGHPSVTGDAHLMSVLRLNGTRPASPSRGGSFLKLSSSSSDNDDDDDDADEEEAPSRHGPSHGEARSVPATSAPQRVDSASPAPHKRLVRPAPDQRRAQSKTHATALPPVNTSSSSADHMTLRSVKTASSVPSHTAQTQPTVRAMRAQESMSGQPMTQRRAAAGMLPQRACAPSSAGGPNTAGRHHRAAPTLQPHLIATTGPGPATMDSMTSPARMAWSGANGGYGVGSPTGAFSPMCYHMNGSPRGPGGPQPYARSPQPRQRMASGAGSPGPRSRGSRSHSVASSVASSVLSSVPSLHASDRFDAVADLRQFMRRNGRPGGKDEGGALMSPPIEDLDIVITRTPRSLAPPSAIAPPSMFKNIGDEWFSDVTGIIQWVPSPNLTPDDRPLL